MTLKIITNRSHCTRDSKRTCTTRAIERKPLESTGVVPAKHSPKVKLEFLYNPRVPELSQLCVPRYLGFLGYLYWRRIAFPFRIQLPS